MPFKKDDKLIKVLNHPLYREFGCLIFPAHLNTSSTLKIKDLETALSDLNYINTTETIKVLNYFEKQIKRKKPLFHDIYSLDEKMREPSKFNTGLFFFEGRSNGPTAIISSGNFSYNTAIHESFPVAFELSKRGINAFALIFRTDASSGTEDLSRAIEYIFNHSNSLKVSMDRYSLWGSSFGAQLSNWVGSNGTKNYIEKSYPRPSTVISNCSDMKEAVGSTPPTFTLVGTKEASLNTKNIETRRNKLLFMGIPHHIEIIQDLKPNFGLGIDSPAEGWFKKALRFWEKF